MAPNTTCVRCNKRPKRKDHQFCSDRCTKIAAKNAPSLLRVPKGHVMYDDRQSLSHLIHAAVDLTSSSPPKKNITVKKSFKKQWKEKTPLPTFSAVYLITWTHKSRTAFEKYR